jgi:adenylate cyclase
MTPSTEPENVTRRFASVLIADVAGYSSLMERDEERTFTRLRALRHDVIEVALSRHKGRLVKNTGDGFVAEFPSPVEAVRCAISVQEQVGARERDYNGAQIKLRMGVNFGDVIVEDDGDIYGDCVNIASRLEQLAAPGGLCVTGKMFNEVDGKIGVLLEDMGEHVVKNMARPIRIYALGGLAERQGQASRPSLPLPDKPSIAILPFKNLSGDASQDYFCDGIVEDMITALSRERWFFVIARNSSFAYKGRAVDIRQVGRELGVRYVLEGSVRKGGNRLRINGQLMDAETGAHVWADKYDGSIEDIFSFQDQVTENVVGALHPRLLAAETERSLRKRPDDLSAYDLYLRALPHAHSISRAGVAAALELLARSLAIEPRFTEAHTLAAWCYFWMRSNAWPGRDDAPASGRRHVLQAMAIEPNDPNVLWIAGLTAVYFDREYERGVELAERSVTLNPNSVLGWISRGWVNHFAGTGDRVIESFERAKRLSPMDPLLWYCHGGIGQAHFARGDYAESVRWSERSLRENPHWTAAWRTLASAYAYLGRKADAQHAVDKVLEVSPGLTVSKWREQTPVSPGPHRETFLEGLRLAGLPD